MITLRPRQIISRVYAGGSWVNVFTLTPVVFPHERHSDNPLRQYPFQGVRFARRRT